MLDVAQTKSQDPLAAMNQPLATSNPTGFTWAQQTLTATGRGKAPGGMPAVQAEQAAASSGRIRALAGLKDQVKDLPVGSDQTVGSIMNTYLTIRHAIEQEIAIAPNAGQQRNADGSVTVQVAMPMQGIADILHRYNITTDQELPAANTGSTANVPDII